MRTSPATMFGTIQYLIFNLHRTPSESTPNYRLALVGEADIDIQVACVVPHIADSCKLNLLKKPARIITLTFHEALGREASTRRISPSERVDHNAQP